MSIGIICLLVIILIIFIGSNYNLVAFKEGYKNNDLTDPGLYPSNVDAYGLLFDEYPSKNSKLTSNNSYPDIWWYYPIFGVGSYAQITNNLRYRRNPDDGECRTAEFCGALYRDNQVASNIIKPLPPVPDTPGTRVNYYRTQENLFLGPQPGPVLELPAF